MRTIEIVSSEDALETVISLKENDNYDKETQETVSSLRSFVESVEYYRNKKDELSKANLDRVIEKRIENEAIKHVLNFVPVTMPSPFICYRMDENVFDLYFKEFPVLSERKNFIDGYKPEIRAKFAADGGKLILRASLSREGSIADMSLITDLLKISSPYLGFQIKEVESNKDYHGPKIYVAPANRLQEVLDKSIEIYQKISEKSKFSDLVHSLSKPTESKIDVWEYSKNKRIVDSLRALGAQI